MRHEHGASSLEEAKTATARKSRSSLARFEPISVRHEKFNTRGITRAAYEEDPVRTMHYRLGERLTLMIPRLSSGRILNTLYENVITSFFFHETVKNNRTSIFNISLQREDFNLQIRSGFIRENKLCTFLETFEVATFFGYPM